MSNFQMPSVIPNSPQGELVLQVIKNAINHPLFGTPFEHHQAQHVAPNNFNDRGQPDYLAPDPGVYSTGITYVANPANPLRGIFCRAPYRPYQDVGGIYYQAQMNLHVLDELGDIFLLDGKYPKRQDKFVINGIDYYATAPATPCQMGETIAAWTIELNRERYPVQNE
jgi:hypothetical protein